MPENHSTKPAPAAGSTSPPSDARPRGGSVGSPALAGDNLLLDPSFVSPSMQPLSRRPTFESTRRTVSPPNSVKAFAIGRRRDQRQDGDSEEEGDDDNGALATDKPACSARSYRSRSDNRGGRRPSTSGVSAAEAQDQQHSSVQGHRKEKLHIDFDYLETLIEDEDDVRAPGPDLANLPDSAIPNNGPMFTPNGDFIDVTHERASISEKVSVEEPDVGRFRFTDQQHTEQSRFNFFSSALESTIHAASFGDLVLPGEHISSLFDFPAGEPDGVWWLNMNCATAGEVWTVCKAFGIHPLTIEDIIHQESREKIELFPSYYFACFRSFASMKDETTGEVTYRPFNVYAVVFREGILSFSFTPNAHASRVRFRISMLKEQVSLSSDWICYALIDHIVDSFGPGITEIERNADAIEDQVFISRPEDKQAFLRRIGLTRKNATSLARLLGGKADVLRAFTKRCTEDYDVTPAVEIALYLGDIQDHAVTMANSLAHVDTMLSRSHANYLAQLQVDNIDMGNKMNLFLSRVTVIATVIVPMHVVTGLFGMNVKVPWKDQDTLAPFFGIMSSIILIAIICLGVARRFRYI
ncbi:putative CorA family metal ion transporter [Colletotrichum sojae]|uniref:Putative CorA family metal ion transporter n=1 Tax=Colletotrichum sojae TaxID=2175907 RepID=A0A8H6IVS2_9PEZI|nr:putative CorA family metal ion transporter [Colletotrichum sojae]